MKSNSHKRFTRKAFPSVDPAVIDLVNKLIDDSTPWLRLVSKLAKGYRVPILRYVAHRAYGHDPMSATLAGIIGGGVPGLGIGLFHLLLDLVRDWIIKNAGVEAADLAEAVLHVLLAYDQGHYSGRKRKRKVRKAYAREREKEVELAGTILDMKDVGDGVLLMRFAPEHTYGGTLAEIAHELAVSAEEDRRAQEEDENDDYISGVEASILVSVTKVEVVRSGRR